MAQETKKKLVTLLLLLIIIILVEVRKNAAVFPPPLYSTACNKLKKICKHKYALLVCLEFAGHLCRRCVFRAHVFR